MRYFIEPTVVFRYDQNGISYPYGQAVDFAGTLKKHGIKRFSWCKLYGRCSMKVLCFSSEKQLNQDAFGPDLPYGLKISERTWR